LAFRHFVSVSGMLVSRLGFDKIPTNIPTKRRVVSKQHTNVRARKELKESKPAQESRKRIVEV
jgi:hypothetical protein